MMPGALHMLQQFGLGLDEDSSDDSPEVRMYLPNALRLVYLLLPGDRELRRLYVAVKVGEATRAKRREL